jgi:Beta-propeller repeat
MGVNFMKRNYLILAVILSCGIFNLPAEAQNVEIEFSTYLGGVGRDQAMDIAMDHTSSSYVIGHTYSIDFPTENAYQPRGAQSGFFDAFITRLDPSGSSLIYSTYLGGSYDEYGYGITVDSSLRAYVTGRTASENFPTANSYQSSRNGISDFFVSIITETGNLFYSTYLGGGGEEYGYGITLDDSGSIYVTGQTNSADFPTRNPYQAAWAGGTFDAFITKFDASGSSLIYSTYLGGAARDGAGDMWDDLFMGIALDQDDCAYITGTTQSFDFPTENPYQPGYAGESDAFVAKLSSSGSALIYSTYLGGSVSFHPIYPADDYGADIAVAPDGCAYITGTTGCINFPTRNPYQAGSNSNWDVFLTKLEPSGSSLSYSTYLGGWRHDFGYSISLDNIGRSYLTGHTYSDDFPTRNAYQSSGDNAAFICRFSVNGESLDFSTYLGGSNGNDYGHGITVDDSGASYVTGWTDSTDFPVKNAYQTALAPSIQSDAFICKLVIAPTPSIPGPAPTPSCGPPVSQPRYILESGDYNGDGTADIAIFREPIGLWAIRGISRVYFGGWDDKPIPGDYDGDGTAEIAIFRETSGLWAIRGISRVYYGTGGDYPVPADYDGDWTADIAIFRESTGLWAARGVTRAYFGGGGDRPIPADYEITGQSAIAIFRPSSGLWAVRGVSRIYYGTGGDWPLPSDYDGDGAQDVAVFRPSTGLWAVRDISRLYYGTCIDYPIRADFNGDDISDIGIFRQESGLWAIRSITRAYFGGGDDLPVTR